MEAHYVTDLQRIAPWVSPLASGLVAAFVVHLLTARRGKEEWVRNQRMSEWKEVMSAVVTAHLACLFLYGKDQPNLSEEDRRRFLPSRC